MASREIVKRKVAVIGWYGHGNAGDEFFKICFRNLFPEYNLDFFDHVPAFIKNYDAMLIGAGGVLMTPNLRDTTHPRYAIVGAEASIGGDHLDDSNQIKLIESAKIAYLRSHVPNVTNTICPDIALSQKLNIDSPKKNQIAVILNNYFCPGPTSPAWHDTAWQWFSHEMAKMLDIEILKHNADVVFVPMCINKYEDDRRAASYVIDKMNLKSRVSVMESADIKDIFPVIKSSSLVVSQRLHGCVFSAMLGVPFIAINGHDKIKNFLDYLKWDFHVNFYGFNCNHIKKPNGLDVQKLLNYCDDAREKWKDISQQVDRALFR